MSRRYFAIPQVAGMKELMGEGYFGLLEVGGQPTGLSPYRTGSSSTPDELTWPPLVFSCRQRELPPPAKHHPSSSQQAGASRPDSHSSPTRGEQKLPSRGHHRPASPSYGKEGTPSSRPAAGTWSPELGRKERQGLRDSLSGSPMNKGSGGHKRRRSESPPAHRARRRHDTDSDD